MLTSHILILKRILKILSLFELLTSMVEINQNKLWFFSYTKETLILYMYTHIYV